MAAMSSVRDLWGIIHRSTALYSRALQDMAEAMLARDAKWERRTVASLAELLRHSLTYANLLGRRRLLLEADAVRKDNPPTGRLVFSESSPEGVTMWEVRADVPMVPNVPFDEAIADLLSREPRLVTPKMMEQFPPGTPKYKAVQSLYSEGHVFALARSNQEHVTSNLQKTIARLLEEGETVETATGQLRTSAILQGQERWSRAYSETVYRTNMNGSFNNGLKEMASDEAVASVIGGFEYNAVRDRDSRPNHRACDGLIAGTANPIWERYTPPLGYNCRCALRLMGRSELEEKGLLEPNGMVKVYEPSGFKGTPPRARPDPGFNGEPAT